VLERALAFANDGLIEVADLALKGARLADAAPAIPEAVAAGPEAPQLAGAAAPAPALSPGAPMARFVPLGGDELPGNLPEYLAQVERDIIMRALNQTQFNRTQAATLLGISLRQLRYQMQKLEINAPEP
jgi:two-component system response regulator PilR (NtrC family)